MGAGQEHRAGPHRTTRCLGSVEEAQEGGEGPTREGGMAPTAQAGAGAATRQTPAPTRTQTTPVMGPGSRLTRGDSRPLLTAPPPQQRAVKQKARERVLHRQAEARQRPHGRRRAEAPSKQAAPAHRNHPRSPGGRGRDGAPALGGGGGAGAKTGQQHRASEELLGVSQEDPQPGMEQPLTRPDNGEPQTSRAAMCRSSPHC
jgi:hypothetical protein